MLTRSWQLQTSVLKRSNLPQRPSLKKRPSHIIGQDVSAANLLDKREILNSQKALLDEVYEATRKEIAGLPESFHREAIKKLLTEAKKEISKGIDLLQCPGCGSSKANYC